MIRISAILSLILAATAFAQPAGPASTGINASLLKMFGEVKAFTAKGEVRMMDKGGKEISALPITMALLDNKLRTEMDMTQMKGGVVPPEAAAMLKQTGMDRMQVLVTPEAKTTLIIYPGLQSYAPAPDDVPAADAKAEITEVGKETVNGHPCVKKKVSAKNANGRTEEAFLWAATDLNNFPIKMQMQQDRNSVEITFGAPSFEKPDAKLFAIPAGYKKYDNVQGLMQAAMMKMFGGGQP